MNSAPNGKPIIFDALFKNCNPDSVFTVWAKDPQSGSKETHWIRVDDRERAADIALRFDDKGWDAYVSTGTTQAAPTVAWTNPDGKTIPVKAQRIKAGEYGTEQPGTARAPFEMVAYFMDIDTQQDAKKQNKADKPPIDKKHAVKELKEATSIYPPTMIVDSGHGIHAWWIFDKPCVMPDANAVTLAGNQLRRFGQAVAYAMGYSTTAVDVLACEPCRVLRVDCTHNHKHDQPIPVTLIERDMTYTHSKDDLDAWTDYQLAERDKKNTKKQQAKQDRKTKPTAASMAGFKMAAEKIESETEIIDIRCRSFQKYCVEHIKTMLVFISPDCDRKTWVSILGAMKEAGVDLSVAIEWSRGDYTPDHKTPANYTSDKDTETNWNSIHRAEGANRATMATLVKYAKDNGWQFQDFTGVDPDILVDDDFTSDELYKAIVELRNKNLPAGAMLQAKCRALAKKHGMSVKDFDIILAAKTKEMQDNLPSTTQQEGFTSVLDSFGYEPVYPLSKYNCSDDNGVWGFISEKDTNMRLVCPHPLIPTRRFVDVNTGAVSLNISFRRNLQQYADTSWTTVQMIPQKDAFTASRIVDILADHGATVTSETAKSVTTYLADMTETNLPVIPTDKIARRLGWLNDGSFIPYSDNVLLDKSAPHHEMQAAVTTEGDLDTWKSEIAKFMDGSHIALEILLCSSFASVLVRNTCDLPFFVHLWSATSSIGKTVAMRAAASVWGNPSEGKLLNSLNGTNVAFEQAAVAMNNLPLFLDELQSLDEKKMSSEQLVYMLTLGVSRLRGKRDGGVRDQEKWRNIIITTGEQPLTDAGNRAGSLNRVINLDVNEMGVFSSKKEADNLKDTIVDNYGWAGREFITHLTSMDNWQKEIAKKYREICNDQKFSDYDITGKQSNSAACILLASKIVKEVFGFRHELSIEDLRPYLQTNRSVDMGRRAYEWLCGLIAAHDANFTHVKEETSAVGEGYAPDPLWGKILADGRCCINTEITRRQFKDAHLDFTAFLKWAAKNGLLEYSEAEQHHFGQKKMRLFKGTSPVWCLVLDTTRDLEPVEAVPSAEQIEFVDYDSIPF